MSRYLIGRSLRAVLVLLTVSAIVFLIFFVLPSTDPALLHAGRSPTPATIARARHELGLDHPVWEQFVIFLRHLILGDKWGWPGLGYDYSSAQSVRSELLARIPVTAGLIAGAMVLWLVTGLAIGVLSAVRPHSVLDRLSTLFSLAAISIPAFWLGLMLLYVFWFKLGIAPPSGYVSPAADLGGWVRGMVLPWVTLSFVYVAWYSRMTRASVTETLNEEFIRTAYAKGASRARVLLRHALRPALSPVVTMLGLDVALLVAGSVVVETVFNLPGVGRFAYQSVQSGNLSGIMGTTLLSALVIVVANLAVDLAYGAIDPRVRHR